MSWVTPEIRAILIARASAALKNLDFNKNFGADRALLELGDKPTIEEYMKEYHEGEHGITYSIELIPYLIEDLMHGDSERIWRTRPSIMDYSTRIMYQIVRVYPCFSQRTRKWAKREARVLSTDGPGSAGNQLMRAWLSHNKAALLERRFGDATWLPDAALTKACHDAQDQLLRRRASEPVVFPPALKPIQAFKPSK